LQALFYFTDHVTLDLSGRRVDMSKPIDVAAVAGLSSFTNRRVIRNGSLNAVAGPDWATTDTISVATYAVNNPKFLTGVANVANIEIGSLVIGTGVGREVYVKSKNVGAGTVELSQSLYGAAGTRSYTFRRFRYMLDFNGFDGLSKFEIEDVEFNCLGLCSGVMLPNSGSNTRVISCTFNQPQARALTSSGTGCQGLVVDMCQFLSNEASLPAVDRTTIAMNIQANDTKIRDNRVVRFAHFAVVNGTGHLIHANHFFQGDEVVAGVRRAGLIFTQTNISTIVSANYVDNCFIEWNNEHDATPEFENELSFGGLNIVGNIFIAIDTSSAFRWVVVKPYGPGHFLNGFSLTGNSFRVFNTIVDRVEMLDTTFATLDFTRSRNVRVEGNAFNQVGQQIMNPVVVTHTQNTAADTWNVSAGDYIPFGGRIRMMESVSAQGAITTAANATRYVFPHALVGTGVGGNEVQLKWGEAVKGSAIVSMRMDIPG